MLWAWRLVITYRVQLRCDPESRVPRSGTSGDRPPSSIHDELSIAPEIAIERQGLGNTQLFHDDKTERIAERIPFIDVTSEQIDGSRLIPRAYPLEVAEPILNILKEPQGKLAAVLRTDPDEGVGFPHDRIGRDQRPSFSIGPLEECASLGVVNVLGNEMREERAGIDEDPSHGFVV